MTPLPNTSVLGAGAVYRVIGLWGGRALRPSPQALRAAFEAQGFVAYFMEGETVSDPVSGSAPSLAGMISPRTDGKTVAGALRVMGVKGATAGGVWISDTVSSEQLVGLAAGDSVGELGASISQSVNDMADSAGEITDVISWFVRNWPIVLVGAVAVWAVATGKVKLT